MIEQALKMEQGLFSPISAIGAESDLETNLSSPTPYPPYTRRGSSILSVPPPTPWIKPEDENFMFERQDDDGLQDDSSILPSVVRPPWEQETLNGEDHYHWTSVSISVPGPESVSTDDVDFFPDADNIIDGSENHPNRIKPSSSAPVFPLPGRKPLRLSIGNTTTTTTTLSSYSTHTRLTSSTGQGHAHAHAHARRHSHAAILTGNRDRRLSIISNTATAFSDWTSGTPEDPDAPLLTPSHTGWRTYQCWPVVNNGSSSTLAHERIEEREGGEESAAGAGAGAGAKEVSESPPVVDRLEPSVVDNEEELNRALMAPSFNQVLTKSLPPNHRISTLLLLGIPVFQCRLDSPPMELIRRIDTDYVNISSIITYAKYLSQAAPTSRSRSQPNPKKPTLPPPPSTDELPPNHVFLNSGARVINGGWVLLSTARALVKNYHDLPAFVRRVFLSDIIAL